MVNVTVWKLLLIVRPLPCWQQDSLLLTGPGIIHKFMIELHILQCLFVRGSNKKQRRGRTISNLQKERLFYFLWQPNALGVISQCGPLLAPSKKGLPLPFSLAKNRKYLDVQLKGELTDLFWKLPGCSVFPRVGIGSWILLY